MTDYIAVDEKLDRLVYKFIHDRVHRDDYGAVYELLGVVRVTLNIEYDKDPMTRNLGPEFVMDAEKEADGSIVLYDSGLTHREVIDFDYSREGETYSFIHWYMRKDLEVSDEDKARYCSIADKLYLIHSILIMRHMLHFARHHDTQSGIFNGVGIRASYRQAVAEEPSAKYVVLYIDLQNFKYINERHGSKTGDEVIVQFSRRLTTYLSADEGVGRLGGDNFVMYVRAENLDRMLHRLESFAVDDLQTAPGKTFNLASWVGVSSDDVEDDIAIRIEHASTAVMFGKQRLRQKVVFYSPRFTEIIENNRRIAALFKPALVKKEFNAYFQAKVDMTTGKTMGFETLCRWIHDGEFIFPDQFIPVIDRMGLIHELDLEILRLTCESIVKWQQQGLKVPVLSVNFSRKDIFIPDIEQQILSIVKEHDLKPGDIEIEITETSSETEYERIMDFTKTLKDMGFRIAIDDFGTGYSSLSLIHNINADVIKIDKSFVSNIQEGSKAEILVESIISIAKKLDMEPVAEGVETEEEGRHLLKMGCVTAQGYYYSRPVDFAHTTEILQSDPYRPIGKQD
jgi:diguanylate cyclase (GGDEF)-like protein